MSNMEQNICEAVDIIVSQALSQAQFDKTIKATIVNLVDSKTGKYKVRYQDDLIYAYAGTADMDFNTGDEVYVLVPQGNFSGDKTILGTTKKIGGAAGDEYVLPENERYEIVGNNVFTEGVTFRLSSYDSYQTRVQTKITPGQYDAETGEWSAGTTIEPYKTGAVDPETFNIDAAGFSHYIKMANYLVLSAKIATNLPEKQQYQGNYGFEVCLRFSTAEEGVFEDKTYRIDVNNIQGFPWGLGVDGIQQYFYFDIPSDKFVSIQYVQIFAENFPAEPEDGVAYDWDIWIKDLSMTAANRISDDDLDSYFVRLVTKNGSNFTSTSTPEKTIEAFVYEKGRDITTNSKLKYYWFYQRADVTTSHPNYCSYGGEGWYCLNDIDEEKDEKGENVIRKTWQSATNKHKVIKATSQQNKDFIFSDFKDNVEESYIINQNKIYKCVVLYDNTIIEKQVIFTRDDVEWDIALATTTGRTTFYRDEGSTQISCTIYDKLKPYLDHKKCTFKWMTINYLNSATLNESQTRTLDVKISSITYSSTYVCSAFINGEYIGTDSITLTNTGEDSNSLYELMMINNSQLFKYDEDGISPTSTAQENPETTLPLLLSIFDNKSGEQKGIGEDAAAEVTIYVPNHHTLIVPKGSKERTETDGEYDIYSYSSTGFAFDIKDKYNPSYKNNTIKVVVVYNKITLIGYTNFTFIKEGEDGTNGTRYVCRIVPNLETGDNSYREWVAWTNNEDGSRSYNFEPASEDNPFRAVLLDGNTKVELTNPIIWSALFRKYTSSIQENSLIEASSPEPGYLGVSSNGAPPASILKATVRYEDGTYYATLPIVDIQRKNFNYNFTINGGFHDVVYSADGTNPKYNKSTPFSITVTDLNKKGVNNVKYQWSILGKVYEKRNAEDAWYDAELLKQDYSDATGTGTTYLVRPSSKYDGLCLSTGVQCVITDASGVELATIIIPIHFYLNRFGHAAINAWDGNSIITDNDAGIILSPQVGAGEKDSNNRFTGLVMGTVKDSNNTKKTGLVGYGKGVESLFIDAQNGSASFGAKGKGQILIKPNTLDSQGEVVSGDAIIEGGNYNYNENGDGSGLQINLSEPSIKYGSGKFQVDDKGILTAHGAKIYGSLEVTGKLDDVFKVEVPYGNDRYTRIDFSKTSASITGNGLDIDFNTGHLSFNGGEKDTQSFTGYIKPSGFYFGSRYYVDKSDNSKKGGSIRYEDGVLTISGAFNAETGQIGGWNIADKELYSSGAAVRLHSGDIETDPKKPIPAFISIRDSDGEFSVSSGSKKVALRKGGVFLYSESFTLDDENKKEKLNNWYGRIYANDTSDSLSISTQEKRPIIFWGANVPVLNEDGKDTEEDRVLMCLRPGDSKAEDYVQIGSKKTGETSTYTRLYYNGIHVRDITPYKKMDTKATTIVDAINEIYPGGPVNIQHATVVLPENKIDILYDYNVVMHTHSNEVGYGLQSINIYAQGYKLSSNLKTGTFVETERRNYIDAYGAQRQYDYYLYRDWNYIKQINPQTEWYGSVTGVFFINGLCQSWDPDEGGNVEMSLVKTFITKHYSTEETLLGSQHQQQGYHSLYVFTADGMPIDNAPFDLNYSYWLDTETVARYEQNPGTSFFCFQWRKINSPQTFSDFNHFGFGFVEGDILLCTCKETHRRGYRDGGVEFEYFSCTTEFGGPFVSPDDRDKHSFIIPFASQAEYEAAVNLISVDQKLYEIEQNKSTSS